MKNFEKLYIVSFHSKKNMLGLSGALLLSSFMSPWLSCFRKRTVSTTAQRGSVAIGPAQNWVNLGNGLCQKNDQSMGAGSRFKTYVGDHKCWLSLCQKGTQFDQHPMGGSQRILTRDKCPPSRANYRCTLTSLDIQSQSSFGDPLVDHKSSIRRILLQRELLLRIVPRHKQI